MTDPLRSPALPGPGPVSAGTRPGEPAREAALRAAAADLEATFLAEMLKAAGLGRARESFGGGAGEDQFATFLLRAQAGEMVKTGGIGLAESLYQALKEKSDEF